MFCNNCEKEFERKKKYNNGILEEYKNVYGTRCPYCNSLIKPDEEPKICSENIKKIEKLKKEMHKKIKNNFNKKG